MKSPKHTVKKEMRQAAAAVGRDLQLAAVDAEVRPAAADTAQLRTLRSRLAADPTYSSYSAVASRPAPSLLTRQVGFVETLLGRKRFLPRIRANNWKVLFVPSARLEFRITEFSWRDIPYFMYKRSEATAHGTRDYLISKWGANFPNTGFWTYIKYTILERHTYGPEQLAPLTWAEQASLAIGFFQMAGYNRYDISTSKKPQVVDFLGTAGLHVKQYAYLDKATGTWKWTVSPLVVCSPPPGTWSFCSPPAQDTHVL